MAKFIVQRLLLTGLTLLGVSLVIFALIQLLPGDAATTLLGSQSGNPEAVARMRAYLGLDQPVHIRYVRWLWNLLQGDFGMSVQLSSPVAPILWAKAVNSGVLALASIILMLGFGLPVGVSMALHRHSLLDRITMFVSLVLANLPVFWLGLIVMYVFSLRLDVFPTSGMYSAYGERTFLGLLHHLILPAIVTAVISFAILMRIVRSAMTDVLDALHMQALAARGIPRIYRIYRHALRAILPVTANVTGLQVGWLFSGALFTEVIFSWPGIGLQLYQAITARDVPMIMGGVLITAVVFVLANLAADVVTVTLDPRRRTELR